MYAFWLGDKSKLVNMSKMLNFNPAVMNILLDRVVVVAQLAEWSLLPLEIRGSNPNIGKVFQSTSLSITIQKRQK